MRISFALVCGIALSLPALAKAEPVHIGFAPPIDRDIAYHIEQERPVAGQVARFTSDRTLRFGRGGQGAGGYTLRVTLRTINTDAPGDSGEPYRAALSPLMGMELLFHLDDAGHVIALDNMTSVWAGIEAKLRGMMASSAEGSARHRAASNVLTLFEAQSNDGRLALLAGEVQPLLLFASSTFDDEQPRTLHTTAGSPLARPVPVEGTVGMVGRDRGILNLTEKLGGEGVVVNVRYHLSQLMGLVVQQERTLVMGVRSLTETRILRGL